MKKLYTENAEFPLPALVKQEIEHKLLFEKINYRNKEELYCKARYKSFFDHYDDETIHSFIEEYARKKALYLLQGANIIKEEETKQLYFRNLAENFIWEIQQKKLFDLQCLWRAGKVCVDGVEVTRDFMYLGAGIRNCNLVERITREEVELYMEYVLSDEYCDEEHGINWQNYDRIKSNTLLAGYKSSVPAWYNYYDKNMRVGSPLELPDTKGESEQFYIDLYNRKKAKEQDDFPANEYEADEKPPLKFNYKTLEFFVTTFEDKSIVKYFYAAEKHHPDLDKNAELDEALQLLRECDEKNPIEANSNWKEAIILAGKQLKLRKTAGAMLTAFDEYNLRIKTKLPFFNETDQLKQQLILRSVAKYKEQILEGRKLNNEPADFDF